MSVAQIFTKTGHYKGSLVALKRITKKNLDITRSMKKEMKVVCIRITVPEISLNFTLRLIFILSVRFNTEHNSPQFVLISSR